jgi:hypothetical protein
VVERYMKFVYGKELFEKFYELSSNAQKRVYIVSAYVGNGSYELLSENVKDVEDVKFIVNFSKESVQVGAISPNGVRQLKTIGQVHTRKDLHAKLYLFDDVAIISSANFSKNAFKNNLEVGIIIDKLRTIQKIKKFVGKLWRESKPVSVAYIDEMDKIYKYYKSIQKKYAVPESGAHPKPEKSTITIPKWKEPINLIKKHIIINISWNPHNFMKECSSAEKITDEQLSWCHEASRCYAEGWDGCTSSTLFRDFEYATSKNAIKKGRIAFFIAPNPNLGGDYYIVGFLTMKSSKPGDKAWGTLYYFKGDPKKSVRLPSKGKGVIKFDKTLINKLDNNLKINWSKKPKTQDDARYIGERVRKNPRYISNKDAKIILEECYAKTKNNIIKQILEENF